MKHQNPAEFVVAKFGGQSALAKILGKRQSTIQHWTKGGIIPARWHHIIIDAGAKAGIDVSPAEFLPRPVPAPADLELVATTEGPSKIPVAEYQGMLPVGDAEIPVFVLSDGRRVLSRSGAIGVLSDGKKTGDLESYMRVEALKGFVPDDLPGQMIDFEIEGVTNKNVRGMEAETFLEICRAYVKAFEAGKLHTDRQRAMAVKAAMFMASCAKTGLIALIDEATGYQYVRAEDALRIKLQVFLEEEMRKWEKTFPDELWREFARLTRHQGGWFSQRPRYWGKLVMELVYGYLDKDVTEWLKSNAPKPMKGQNYHQWLSSQYGLKRLTEHLWMVIGMGSACHDMKELREKMAERFGKERVQLTLYLPRARTP